MPMSAEQFRLSAAPDAESHSGEDGARSERLNPTRSRTMAEPPITPPEETYRLLMRTIRGRLDLIAALQDSGSIDFVKAEAAAFQGRKIVESIAFGCLVAVENGLKAVPRDAKGRWNAEDILRGLGKKGLEAFPSPSVIRAPTDEERQHHNVRLVVEGVPERRLSRDELIKIYQRLHGWLHETNPYVYPTQQDFYAKWSQQLWDDLSKLRRFIEEHFISIRGAGFFCATHDNRDGQTKVIGLNKLADLGAV